MSLTLERLMEEKDVPEEDRDELRMFAAFLKRRGDKKAGHDVGPLPDDMRDWLLGKDARKGEQQS